jgi:hypothetical protein
MRCKEAEITVAFPPGYVPLFLPSVLPLTFFNTVKLPAAYMPAYGKNPVFF